MNQLLKVSTESYRRQDDGNIGPMTIEKVKANDGTMVTIICSTYNHEKFIRNALDSFLMQKTNFEFKVFIGEDHGSDHTADIIREYAKKYPDIIIPFIRKKNMGAQRNLIDLCQRATSPYIAFCEGDDYWTDPLKLQKQVNFMEENKNIAVCGTRTEIKAPLDWQFADWYKKINGRIIIPDSNPSLKNIKRIYQAYEYVSNNILHTSTFFFRWNYDLNIPEWYYKGIIGDAPILLMQARLEPIALLSDVTSIYRINEGSVFFAKDLNENFIKTRMEYVRWLSGFENFVKQNYPNNILLISIENRIKAEAANYLNTLVNLNRTDDIVSFFKEDPNVVRLVLSTFISFYNDSKRLTSTLTWDGYKLISRHRFYRNGLRPYVYLAKSINSLSNKLRPKLKNLINFICYWLYSIVPKNKEVWVFSGFNKCSYMDNTKYLYEWVIEHHPEIEAYWITKDVKILQQLRSKGMPVLKFRTFECIKIMSQAKVAFTDHFVMSDYEAMSGFNNRINVVQLWHGVGLKAIGNLENTDINGVQFSDDILPNEKDSAIHIIKKKFKYIRHAYFRELFEQYFLLVCPGEERIKQIADKWNIPRSHCFKTGHPRNFYLYKVLKSDKLKVLYAPTYRWDKDCEEKMINDFFESLELIEQTMNELDGEFVIRLHPHTWRNYSNQILSAIKMFPHIKYDSEPDVYKTLGSYSIMISDFSSIAYDFVLLDRPIIFYCSDIDQFVNDECNLNYDYYLYSPGPKTNTWEDTLKQLRIYRKHPEKDSDWRQKVRAEFYDMRVNDEYNSERIVNEVKRRLKFK